MKILLVCFMLFLIGCQSTPEGRRDFARRLHYALSTSPPLTYPDTQAHEEHIINHAQPVVKKTAMLENEVVTGSTKQCIYDFVGQTHIVTMSRYQICPLSHNF